MHVCCQDGGNTDRGNNGPTCDSESDTRRKNSLLDTLIQGSSNAKGPTSSSSSTSSSDLVSTLQQDNYKAPGKSTEKQQSDAPEQRQQGQQQEHPLLLLLKKSLQNPDSMPADAQSTKDAAKVSPDGPWHSNPQKSEGSHPLIRLLREAQEPKPANSNPLLDILKGQ